MTKCGLDFRQWLKARPEKVIAVVTHSGFLRIWISHTKDANADYRIFDFADDTGDELVEWECTEHRGGGMGKSEKGKAYVESTEFPQEHREEGPKAKQAPEEVGEEAPR